MKEPLLSLIVRLSALIEYVEHLAQLWEHFTKAGTGHLRKW